MQEQAYIHGATWVHTNSLALVDFVPGPRPLQ
jgi:hypothetical protein